MIKLHEWSLAGMIIEAVDSLVKREGGGRIVEVEIEYGEMMGLELDILEFALKELSKMTALEKSRFSFKKEKASFKCRSCGNEWTFGESSQILEETYILEEPQGERESPLHFIPDLAQVLMKCPRCRSRDFEVISGKDIKITKITLER